MFTSTSTFSSFILLPVVAVPVRSRLLSYYPLLQYQYVLVFYLTTRCWKLESSTQITLTKLTVFIIVIKYVSTDSTYSVFPEKHWMAIKSPHSSKIIVFILWELLKRIERRSATPNAVILYQQAQHTLRPSSYSKSTMAENKSIKSK